MEENEEVTWEDMKIINNIHTNYIKYIYIKIR